MRFKNRSRFKLKGLNQEKLLNEISKKVSLSEIDRKTKNEISFSCSYFDRKKTEKILKEKQIDYSVSHSGVFEKLGEILTSYGMLLAIVVSLFLYFFQSQYILQYEINGLSGISRSEVVEYIKQNYSNRKSKVDTQEIEMGLLKGFSEISFVSCIIKGQTLVLNIKEKLLPEQMYGQFQPIIAQKSGTITDIELVSGTVVVKVGDVVKAGDVLVEPYTVDTSGEIKKVEAHAKITADVYNLSSVDHYDSYIEVKRTGKVVESHDITLFGLKIYDYNEEIDFKMYEVEYEKVDLTNNLFFPFKLQRTVYYELSETLIENTFEEVKNVIIENAKEKVLKKCQNCDNIIEEFYTIRHLSGVTIVNYCIITSEEIGGFE